MDCCKRGKDTGQDRQARRTIIGNYRRLREFVWVGGCVTTPAMWASPPGRRTQECTQIGGNGLSGPFWGICVHCCAVGLGCGWPWDRNSVHKWEDRASPRRIGAFVYTVATRVAIRIATRAASGGTSASATMACRRRLLAGPSRLVGKTGSARVAPLPGWHLRRGVNPHEPLKSRILPAICPPACT